MPPTELIPIRFNEWVRLGGGHRVKVQRRRVRGKTAMYLVHEPPLVVLEGEHSGARPAGREKPVD